MASLAGGVRVRQVQAPSVAESEAIQNLWRSSLVSLSNPIWRTAMRRGWELHLRSAVLVVIMAVICSRAGFSVRTTAVASAVAAMVVPALCWAYAWSQMFQAGMNAVDLTTISKSFQDSGSGLGSRLWVAETGASASNSTTNQTNGDAAVRKRSTAALAGSADGKGDGAAAGCETAADPAKSIVGLLALKKKSAGEAEMLYLCLQRSSNAWDDITDALLGTAVKHAKAAGFRTLTATVVGADMYARQCYERAGFKEGQAHRLTGWYSLVPYKLVFGR